MSQCNYCTNKYIIKKAEDNGVKLTYIENKELGGVDVYMHPDKIVISDLNEKDKEQYFICWFMELPEKCCC